MDKYSYIGRKVRTSKLKENPAVVIATFGSTGSGKAAFEIFEKTLRESMPQKEFFWTFTSQIIRSKTGQPGPVETLADLDSQGYKKAVVQPLYVFPGTEYEELLETCNYFPGMRVIVGETLFHRWPYVKDILGVLQRDFIPPDEGLNLVVAHGTPLAATTANTVYLGLENMLSGYPNVLLATIEGVPDKETAFSKIAQNYRHCKKIRIIPAMYIAGVHVENDLLGEGESWKKELEGMGFLVDFATVTYKEKTYPKGLSFYQEINGFFVDRLKRILELINYY